MRLHYIVPFLIIKVNKNCTPQIEKNCTPQIENSAPQNEVRRKTSYMESQMFLEGFKML